MRSKSSLIAFVAALVIGASPVFAANPHLVRADAHFDSSSRDLTITYKIAGLGNGEAATVTVSGDYSIDFTCSKNGRDPKGQGVPFRSPRSGDVAQDVGVADENGNVNGSFSVNLAPPVCPRGWSVDVGSVSFTFDRMNASHSAGSDVMDVTWY